MRTSRDEELDCAERDIRRIPRLFVVLLLFILSSCIAQPQPRDTKLTRDIPSIPPINSSDPDGGKLLSKRYDFDAWLLARPKLPEHAIIISMSGGATRAAVMAQSVLQALGQFRLSDNEDGTPHNLADDVIAISGVSGGAMTAAAFVLDRANCREADTAACDGSYLGLDRSTFDRDILRKNLLDFFIFQADLNPFTWTDRAGPWINFFDQYFQTAFPRNTGGSFTYADLGANPRLPFLILNSTDILNDHTFSFIQEQFSDLCADLNEVPLSVGVAAAGNFPFLSSDIELRNYRTVDECARGDAAENSSETMKLAREMDNPYGDPDHLANGTPIVPGDAAQRATLESANWARYRLAMRMVNPTSSGLPDDGTDPARRIDWMHLYDGGIADNLGLWPIARLLNEERLIKLRALGVKDITLIVVNARWDLTPARNLKSGSPYMTQLFLDVGFDPIDRATALTEDFAVDYLRQEFNSFCHREPGSHLTAGRACGNVPAELYPVILDFDQLDGNAALTDLREEVKNFGDDESLGEKPPKNRDANGPCRNKICVVARAGRALLARNPCFKAFVDHSMPSYIDNYDLDEIPGPSVKPVDTEYPSPTACHIISASP